MNSEPALLLTFLAWVSFGPVLAVVMGRRGHSPWTWGLLGIFLGPLAVPSGIDVTARLMEATASGRAVDEAHAHPGPEAFFLLDGSICLETQAGPATAEGGESMILPARAPMQLASSRDARTRALLLVIHPTGEQWIDRQPSWTPTGGCY